MIIKHTCNRHIVKTKTTKKKKKKKKKCQNQNYKKKKKKKSEKNFGNPLFKLHTKQHTDEMIR